MNSFQIKASSWAIYFLTFFCIPSIGAILGRELYPKINTVLYAIALLVLSALLARRFGVASTEWLLNKSEIQLKWMSQFLFHKRSDMVIKWDDIKGYQIRYERTFDLLKLVLKMVS